MKTMKRLPNYILAVMLTATSVWAAVGVTNHVFEHVNSLAPVPPLPKGLSLVNIRKVQSSIPFDTWTKNDIGKEVRGLRLIAFDEKYEIREIDGKKQKVDVSLLTVQHDGKTIRFRRSPKGKLDDYLVRFHLEPENLVYDVAIGDEFNIRKEEFTLSDIDVTNETAVLVRTTSGKELRLGCKNTDNTVANADIDRFLQAVEAKDFERMREIGRAVLKESMLIPNHKEQFETYPSKIVGRPDDRYTRYTFYDFHRPMQRFTVTLYIDTDTGLVRLFKASQYHYD